MISMVKLQTAADSLFTLGVLLFFGSSVFFRAPLNLIIAGIGAALFVLGVLIAALNRFTNILSTPEEKKAREMEKNVPKDRKA